MNRILKQTSFVTLLIIAAIILTHNILPHNHHSNIFDAAQHKHETTQHKAPVHCHFLNNLITKKYFKKQFTNNISISADINHNTFIYYSKLPLIISLLTNLVFLKSTIYFIKITPVRGSPLF